MSPGVALMNMATHVSPVPHSPWEPPRGSVMTFCFDLASPLGGGLSTSRQKTQKGPSAGLTVGGVDAHGGGGPRLQGTACTPMKGSQHMSPVPGAGVSPCKASSGQLRSQSSPSCVRACGPGAPWVWGAGATAAALGPCRPGGAQGLSVCLGSVPPLLGPHWPAGWAAGRGLELRRPFLHTSLMLRTSSAAHTGTQFPSLRLQTWLRWGHKGDPEDPTPPGGRRGPHRPPTHAYTGLGFPLCPPPTPTAPVFTLRVSKYLFNCLSNG